MARPPGHPDSSLIATARNHEYWATVDDRTKATQAARDAANDRFLREAHERFGDLPADELARRAESLRKAYFARLALKSAQARRARSRRPDDREAAA